MIKMQDLEVMMLLSIWINPGTTIVSVDSGNCTIIFKIRSSARPVPFRHQAKKVSEILRVTNNIRKF